MADELLQYINSSPFYAGFDLEEKDMRARFLRVYDILQDKLKDLLVSETTATKMVGLGKIYNLSDNQVILLAMITRYTVVGDIFLGDMPNEISRRLGIDPTTAREIANQIVSQLFTPVLEDIKKVQAAKFPGRLPRQNFAPQNLGGQAPKPATPLESAASKGGLPLTGQAPPSYAKALEGKHYQGEDLPESGGNIIDLRSK